MQATTVQSTEGMVVGPGQAVGAGVAVLRAGGNAVDAAVAAALAAGVVAPAECGLAGCGGALVTYHAATGQVGCVEFGARAPAAVDGVIPAVGYLALAVPGTPAGLARALARYGTLSFAEAAAPAIQLAREGFPASPAYVAHLEAHQQQIAAFPETAEWLLPGGRVPAPGDLVTNEAHAQLLEQLAAEGVESFYRGSIAHAIAAHVQAQGGMLTKADLAAYTPREGPALGIRFHDYEIQTAPLPAGGASVLQGLKILEEMDLNNLWRQSLRYYHTLLLTLQAVWTDRLAYLGDPEAVAVPLDWLLSDAHAATLRQRVEQQVHAAAVLHGPEVVGLPGGTVQITTADRHGGLASLALTHGSAFGPFVSLPGTGTLLGGGMDRFDPLPGRANSAAPGKRPLHDLCPVLVLKEGRPILALGGFGGRKIVSAVLQCLVYFCGVHLPVEDAVAYARLHTEGAADLWIEPHLPRPAADYLRALGYTLSYGTVATVHAVQRVDGGRLIGIADPRTAGLAVGL